MLDYREGDPRQQRDARRYLLSDDCATACDYLGVNRDTLLGRLGLTA